MDAGWSPKCETIPAALQEWGVLKTTSVQPLQFWPHENKALPKKLKPRINSEVTEGDILITRAGPRNRVGICCVAKSVRPRLMLSDKIIRFKIFGDFIFSDYCALYLNTGYGSEQIERMKSGMADSQVNVSQNKLKQLCIALPPLAEQHRIVAKIDQLMARCDELEKLRVARDRLQITVHKVACDRLLTAKDPDTFTQSWQFITQHFNELYSVKENVTELRKAILQLAVMGKLVPQDLNDLPACKLLKEIKEKKQILIKEKKLKAQKQLPEVELSEIPYELPLSWKWCRWNDIALQIGDIDHKMPAEADEGIPYVSPRDFFGENEINFQKAKKISIQDFKRLSLKIRPERFDVIFPRYGTLGVNRFVLTDIDFLASYSCAIVKNLRKYIDPKYSYYYSISRLVRNEIERYKKTTTQANVGVKSIQLFLYPLPPLPEQHRIVAKVDQLMTLCDQLEQQIDKSTQTQTALLNATLANI